MPVESLPFAGTTLLLDASGALFWPELSTLVVTDLHLEKGSACAARGQLVPPWDSRTTLERLSRLVARFAPATLVALGDSFHDDGGAGRLQAGDAATLHALAERTRLVWIAGNHDRAAHALPGRCVPALTLGPITFRHQAEAQGESEISGHFHPKARVATRIGEVTRACFVVDSARILLPAFGAYTGGMDIRSPAIARLFPRGARAFLLGRDRVFGFALSAREAAYPD